MPISKLGLHFRAIFLKKKQLFFSSSSVVSAKRRECRSELQGLRTAVINIAESIRDELRDWWGPVTDKKSQFADKTFR